MGALFIGLIYSTKSENGPVITIGRSGDTAPALAKPSIDSATVPPRTDSVAIPGTDSLIAPDPTAIPLAPGPGAPPSAAGSSAPTVVPADIEALRAQRIVVPVGGVDAARLVDSFDDMRGGTRRHNALDIMAPRNSPVVAATSGTVVKLHNSRAGGLTIYISDPTSRFVMMYGHLESYRPGLKEGMAVKRGELIGFVGTTGNANPTAPHLHFQITRNDNIKEWWKGTPLNPYLVYHPN
ncbi:MAG TPA: M23 family metallopeptidase [Gemmatimonadaceae bacterium]|nr:M23 family metallopeptidase [Gemmatimonadaceae bacterium]